MSQQNVELARQAYDALNRRDLHGFLGLMDISLLPAACGGGDSGEQPAAAPGAEAGDPATDKLAHLVPRGTLTLCAGRSRCRRT
jgi:hypothetical protein